MNQKLQTLFDGLDLNEIEVEDQGFFESGYEVECYHDVYLWNPARTARTNDVGFEGDTICPRPFVDKSGNLDYAAFIKAIHRVINQCLDDEDRIGPVYVVC